MSGLADGSWLSAAAAAAAGLIGALVLWALQRRRWAPSGPALGAAATVGPTVSWRPSGAEPSRGDLEVRLADCIDALRDLQGQAHRLEPAAAAAATAELEAQAAGLSALLQLLPVADATGPRPRRGHRSLWVLLFALVASLLLWRLGVDAQRLPAVAPPTTAAAAPVQQIRELSEQLGRAPDDLQLILRLSHLLLHWQMLTEAQQINDRALRLDPANIEAQVHAVALRAAHRELKPDAAAQALAQLCEKAPTFAEAWFFRGILAAQAKDVAGARHSLQQCLTLSTDAQSKQQAAAALDALGAI